MSDSLSSLFRRFLGFGLRAWGGPAAQIAMIRDELVTAQWVTSERFNRLLAVYQVLPGPEAAEMCVHMGFLRRGRLGGLVAGLGFMLPGFLLILGLAWAYVELGARDPMFMALLAGFPPAVAALVAAACLRLGRHVVTNSSLGIVTLAAALLSYVGMPFYLVLPAAGIGYLLHRKDLHIPAVAVAALVPILHSIALPDAALVLPALPVTAELGLSGFKAGLLTFGGAYTSIPFLEGDVVGRHVDYGEFTDGLALSGIVPAPLVIFATFLGFIGGGFVGALAMTAGIFLPAFAFTLLGHRHLEGLANHPRLAQFLDGVTAGVIGLLASTALILVLNGTDNPSSTVLFVAALLVLATWKSKWATPIVILASGAVGAVLAWG